MEWTYPGRDLIRVTYAASRAQLEALAELQVEWGQIPLILVHTDLPFPIYRERRPNKGWDIPELPEEIGAFA